MTAARSTTQLISAQRGGVAEPDEDAGRLAGRGGSDRGGSDRGGSGRGGRRRLSEPVPGPSRALRWLLPLRVSYLISWEIVAIAGLVAYAHRTAHNGKVIFAVVVAIGVITILLTSIRRHGLTGLERIRARRTMHRRLAGYRDDDQGHSVQHRLLAGLRLNNHIDRAGNRTGVIGKDRGWSAAIKIADSAVPDPDALIAAATRACTRADLPLAAAQVLTWSLPSSWQEADPTQPAGTLRQFFLAVRVADRPSRIAALARGGGAGGAQRATASAAASLAYDITQLGYGCSVLDSAELEQHVQLLSGTAGFTAQASGDAELLENKSSWSAGRMEQSCFRTGAGTSQADALIWSVTQPLNFVIASCLIAPGRRGQLRREFMVRAGMVNQPGPLTVEQAGRALDKRLTPVRYSQENYVRASLPLALDPDSL